MNQSNPKPVWLLPVLSGIFIGTSYIPFPPWASLFCFVPLWIFWKRQTRLKTVLLGGLLTSFVFTLIGFNWVTYLLHEFAHLDWGFAVVGMIIYALIAHLYVPLAGLIWFLIQRKFKAPKHLSLGLLVLITIICERYSLTLFDWNFGYSWYGANLPVYQWAEFIGFNGLSAATLLCNLPLYLAWEQRKQLRGKIILVVVAVGFVLLNIGGLALRARIPKPDALVTALLVQASTENSEKMAAELGKGYSQEILNRYTSLTDRALKEYNGTHIDFAVWPETAFPALLGPQFTQNRLPKALTYFLQERQLPLITGAYSVEENSQLITNSLFVLNNDGQLISPHYSKSILLAFGEYIPGEQFFPQIRDWLPATGHFARGAGPTQLLEWNGFKMGAQICYESLFPAFSRSLAQLGAEFIVNVTNDSWYGTWQEPYQHFYMTLARGIEFRRPVLRVTNTGISTVALASGEILERSPVHEPWTGVYQIPYLKNPPITFYQTWFGLIPGLLWTSLLVMLGLVIRRRSKK
ncbi:MAG: apolipoprotein N-acyltransferase [Methylococcales bacterium]|nr:MAG: apolipoprotein N-acyltransferase [Methylococcales bacterium]